MTEDLFPHAYEGDDRLNQIFRDRARLPQMLRRVHALQTGLPDPNFPPRPTTPFKVLAGDLLYLAAFMITAGTFATMAAAHMPTVLGTLFLIVSLYAMLGIIGRLRRLVVGHTHEASHWVVSKFYQTRGLKEDVANRLNERILDLGSVISLTRNGIDYRRAHIRHHDEMFLGTLRDPDGMDLYAWGLWPGLGTSNLAVDVIATVLDPIWHTGMIASRLRSNLLVGTVSRRLQAAAMLALLALSVFAMPFPAWVVAILLPWTVGYNTAALLQVLTEHPYGAASGAATMAEHADRNWERVPIDPLPAPDMKRVTLAIAWFRWSLRAALLHVPSRLAVLDDSMIAHGWHHMAWPLSQPFYDWWDTAFHMLSARAHGTLPKDAATRVVRGLPEALSLQAARFRERNGTPT